MNASQSAVPRAATSATSAESVESPELPALLLGAGFALASLILLPALAQRIGMASSVTLALRGALMRAANRV